KSPLDAVVGESKDDVEDFIIRPAFLPIILASKDKYSGDRVKLLGENSDQISTSLTNFLQNIFRKKTFREDQLKSIISILRGNDTVILLPTGAGKSFIYQLAGMLLPGITVVIDPIVSLMDDQVEGLKVYGIDRIVAIYSGTNTLKSDIKRIAQGEYQFVFQSPERLQIQDYKVAIRELAQSNLINLAVIDEAHCVSEWGHDFRPAYLNVSRNLRNLGRDSNKKPPVITALTGTASRSVLRDVVTDLEIDVEDEDSLIRPDSFDRKELKFFLIKTDGPSFAETDLKGVLSSLPNRFNIPQQEFYRENGFNTYSGIVFTPFVGKG
ncbi:uncharacterized protein METZ01_LOCUS347649, partial [marine metagenome]